MKRTQVVVDLRSEWCTLMNSAVYTAWSRGRASGKALARIIGIRKDLQFTQQKER